MKLTPEDLARLQAKELANAIRKLHAGKTLTTSERALLAQASVGSGRNYDSIFSKEGGRVKGLGNITRRV